MNTVRFSGIGISIASARAKGRPKIQTLKVEYRNEPGIVLQKTRSTGIGSEIGVAQTLNLVDLPDSDRPEVKALFQNLAGAPPKALDLKGLTDFIQKYVTNRFNMDTLNQAVHTHLHDQEPNGDGFKRVSITQSWEDMKKAEREAAQRSQDAFIPILDRPMEDGEI